MCQSDNSEDPLPAGAQRNDQGRSRGVWLPPDVLVTWWERLLTVVALLLVMWLLLDIAWQEL
jgi:hypothetical protein